MQIKDCVPGDRILIFIDRINGPLADAKFTSQTTMEAMYMGEYDRTMGDRHLLGWKALPPGFKDVSITSLLPALAAHHPKILNIDLYKNFRWVGSSRLVHSKLGMEITAVSTGELSPEYAPGWHQCKCGFRNKDISISALVNGVYRCRQCRVIWVK